MELLLVFIPGLMWFFDRYLKLLLLSYILSAIMPFTWLFSEALSTNLFSILPSCSTSSLVTCRENLLVLDFNCYMYFQVTFSYIPFMSYPFTSSSYFDTWTVLSKAMRIMSFLDLSLILISSLFTRLLMVLWSGMHGTLVLACAITTPSVYLYGRWKICSRRAHNQPTNQPCHGSLEIIHDPIHLSIHPSSISKSTSTWPRLTSHWL